MICAVCGQSNAERHHVFFGTGDRKISEQYGLIVYLCQKHHRSNEGVHGNRELDLHFKKLLQAEFEQTHTRAEWMQALGRNYL